MRKSSFVLEVLVLCAGGVPLWAVSAVAGEEGHPGGIRISSISPLNPNRSLPLPKHAPIHSFTEDGLLEKYFRGKCCG